LFLLGIAGIASHVHSYSSALHTPHVIALVGLPILAVLSLINARPLGTALMLSVLVPVAIHPSSLLVGVAFGVAAFVVLLCACLAIGTVLMWRDERHSSRSHSSRR
jgi:hypothetical protein